MQEIRSHRVLRHPAAARSFPHGAKERTGREVVRGEGKFFLARSATKRIPGTFFSDRITYRLPSCVCHGAK